MNSFPVLAAAFLVGAGAPAGAQTPASAPPQVVTLRSAVAAALARSPSLAAAEAASDEGAAGARLARDAYRPSASLIATPGYASGLPVAVAGQVPAIAGIDVRQTIWDPAAKAEELGSEAAREELDGARESARIETARAVVELYARCRADGAVAEAAARRVDAAQEVLRHVEARQKEGRETDLAVERAALLLARARQKSLDAASDADLDLRELRMAIGASPGRELLLPDDPASVLPAEVPDREAAFAADPALCALERRGEILDALRRAKARPIAPVVQAEAQYWRLASGSYARYYNHFKADDWSVGVAVAVPLFSGGRLAEERARSESAWRRVEAQARERRETLDLLFARAEAAAARAGSAAALARRARGVAEGALEAAEALAREGRGDADAPALRRLELSDADEEVADAERALAAARGELLAVSGRLLAALQ
ncbi:MAG TPA: TolC family protein [Thermoanaerobaculia bacterium]|jgi:outer membrane protein|nr:TolC family protein [Thermoanaerobaculia bacterium]